MAITLALGTVAAVVPAHAAPAGRSFVWLVGGGTDADVTQWRMSRQIRGIAEALRPLSGSGSGTPRVKVTLPDATPAGRELAEPTEAQQVISWVYGPAAASAHPQRMASTTDAQRLSQMLARDFGAMSAADRGLFVYSGQGRTDPDDRAADALKLADDTRLSVRELDTLATRVPVAAPMRFLLAQCQTAGFMRLMRPSAQDVRRVTPYNRCGFSADTPVRQSEGCTDRTASIDTGTSGNAQDYTSAFFAALGGRGRVTLHQAHLYALLSSDDAERPAATSEVFLERWQPTWMRYLDTSSEHANNEYGETARALGRKLDLPDGGPALAKALRQQRKARESHLERLDQEIRHEDGDIRNLLRPIRRALAERWPEADDVLSATTYGRIPPASVKDAYALIQAQPGYAELVKRRQQRAALVKTREEEARAMAQLDKLVRLRQLARLVDQFERFATADERRDYERVNQCERTPL